VQSQLIELVLNDDELSVVEVFTVQLSISPVLVDRHQMVASRQRTHVVICTQSAGIGSSISIIKVFIITAMQ